MVLKNFLNDFVKNLAYLTEKAVVILAILTAFFTPVVKAGTKLICENLARASHLTNSPTDRKNFIDMGAHFIKGLLENNKQYSKSQIMRKIRSQPDFAATIQLAFPSSQFWTNLPVQEKFSRVSYYVALRVIEIEKHVEEERNSYLLKELTNLGAKPLDSETGYELLNRISKENLNDLLPRYRVDFQEKTKSYEKNIDSVLKTVKFRPSHFSNVGHEGNRMPIISTRVLRDLGLTPGQHSGRHFNLEFLASDGNVFHFPAVPNLQNATRYGSNFYYLNDDFAKTWAWVTPGTMDFEHLRDWAVTNGLAQMEQVKSYKDLVSAKQMLYKFAFNFKDFTQITRTALKHKLHQLLLEDKKRFHSMLRDLEEGKNIAEALFEAHAPIGVTMSSGMELKVPVLIEAKHITAGKFN